MAAIVKFGVIVAWIYALPVRAEVTQYYLEERCGNAITDVKSCLLDTSQALTYSNNLNCRLAISAPAGQRLYMQIRRYSSELQTANSCYDYFNIYDGQTSLDNKIVDTLCGELSGELEYFSTGNSVLFEFVSDDSAKDRGFSIYLLAFTNGSCSDSQIDCTAISGGICIDEEDSVCNYFNHCPNGIDEENCLGISTNDGALASVIGLAVGLACAGIVFIVIIIIIVYFVYRKYQWNKFLKQLYSGKGIKDLQQNLMATIKQELVEAAYPVTAHYQSDELVNKMRMERDAALITLPVKSETNLSATSPIQTTEPNDDYSVPTPEPEYEGTDTQAGNEDHDRSKIENSAGSDNEAYIDNEKVTEL